MRGAFLPVESKVQVLFAVKLRGGALCKVVIFPCIFLAQNFVGGYHFVELQRISMVAIGMELQIE